MKHSRAGAWLLPWLLAAAPPLAAAELTFEERVEAQEAIERVYYAYRTNPTASFEQLAPREVIAAKVRKYLAQSAALEQTWRRPLSADGLQRELQRIARGTLYPARLQAIYDALGRDPVRIQECFVRPVLADRIARARLAADPAAQAGPRAEIERLAGLLRSGELDPARPHPRRELLSIVRSEDPDVRPVPGTTVAARRPVDGEEFRRLRERAPSTVGEIGAVREYRDRFELAVALPAAEDRAEIALFTVPKLSWEEWWSQQQAVIPALEGTVVARSLDELPPPGGPAVEATAACPADDTWDNRSLGGFPDRSAGAPAFWTGTEVLLWFGAGQGWRYDPLLDSWMRISPVGAPSGYSAAWTGADMIVWFGGAARYDPVSDSWQPIADPPSVAGELGVWTGTELLTWGNLSEGSGARYDPATDIWSALSSVNAPSNRERSRIIWTGSEMIVWGGSDAASSLLDDGARYDPSTDSWSAIASARAPSPRRDHSAIWTGSEMIVWGGEECSSSGCPLDDGARYDPGANRWTPIETANAPSARGLHSAVWDGDEMIVWGGTTGGKFASTGLSDGGRYDPAGDQWASIPSTGAPAARYYHSAVLTGSGTMFVWGGRSFQNWDTGGLYDPATSSWSPTATSPAPVGRRDHTAVWTGTEMLVWGGNGFTGGGRYDAIADAWSPISTVGAPPGIEDAYGFWTGHYMLLYVGRWEEGTAARYDPISDTWLPVSAFGAPSFIVGVNYVWPAATWAGKRMAVVGVYPYGPLQNTGAFYDPEGNHWEPIAFTGAPDPLPWFGDLVWTGDRLIQWGGSLDGFFPDAAPGTGHIYDPATGVWSPISQENAPIKRHQYRRPIEAVWTGSRMLIWGGSTGLGQNTPGTGGLYDPLTDRWTGLPTLTSPVESSWVWTGTKLVIWGGRTTPSGIVFDPETGTSTPTSAVGPPTARGGHSAVWTGGDMIVWGGAVGSTPLRSGGRYVLGQNDDRDGDGFSYCAGDCDDLDPSSHPGAPELCDGRDNDCDGVLPAIETVDADFDRAPACVDCDDGNPAAFPGNPERCDGVDNDCDGVTDDVDLDEDGFLCPQDCNDLDPEISPAAAESNDGLDDDCDGIVDELGDGIGFLAGGATFCWDAQPGAIEYEVVRCDDPAFPGGCTTGTTADTCWTDPAAVDPGTLHAYLARASQPGSGSWGADSTGAERLGICDREWRCRDGVDDDGDGRIDCQDVDDCYGREGCAAEFGFLDRPTTDDVASQALTDFFASVPVGMDDYVWILLYRQGEIELEFCLARADLQRDGYLSLAATGGTIVSGAWEKWYRQDGFFADGPWTGPITDSFENRFGDDCAGPLSWCPEVGLGGFMPGADPAETGACEVFEGTTCSSIGWYFIVDLAPDRLSACGF